MSKIQKSELIRGRGSHLYALSAFHTYFIQKLLETKFCAETPTDGHFIKMSKRSTRFT